MIEVANIWLEFEEWEDRSGHDPTRDYFNMQVTLADGRRYALNVWTFGYAASVGVEVSEEGDGPIYSVGPDLLVEALDRPHVEEVVCAMLNRDEFKSEWLISETDDSDDVEP